MKIRTIKKKINKDREGILKMTRKERRWFFKAVLKSKSIRNTIIRGMILNEKYLEAYNLMNIDRKIKINWIIIEDDFTRTTTKLIRSDHEPLIYNGLDKTLLGTKL